MSTGILYMVTGERYLDEARRSAESASAVMPDVERAIATDATDADLAIFDQVIEYEFERQEIDGRSWLMNSTIPPNLSPFDRTLYLDSDTYLAADVTEVFELLEDFDLAMCPSPKRTQVQALPEPWYRFNCGVIAYRDTPNVRSFLDRWNEIYRRHLHERDDPIDQPSYAEALAETELRWFNLPRQYNVRVPRRGQLSREAKIIHGRHPAGLEQVAEVLNKSDRHRIYRDRSWWTGQTHKVYDRGTLRYHIERTLTNYGPLTLMHVTAAYTADKLLGTSYMDRFDGYEIG